MSIQFNPLIFSGLDLTGSGSAGSVEWREPVANEASLPLVGNLNGEARVTLDTDKIYVWDETSARWVDTGITSAGFGSSPNAQGQTIGTDDSTPNIRRRTLALQPADATNPGGVSTASQSFAGAKTFLDQVKIDEASNQLVLGTNKTTTLNAPNPTTNRVVTIPDAGADSSVVLTESAQTINGAKTFSATVNTDGGIDVTATAGTDTLTIGGSNADVVNIGRSGTTVNIVGTTINQIVTNLNVTDKNITLNSGGAAGSGATSGIDVEENGAITGYVEVSGNRNSWELKAPNTAGIATITPGASGITIDQSSHDPVSLAAVGSSSNSNGASLSGQQLTLQPANATNPGVLTSGTQTIGGDKTFVDLLKSQTGLALEDPGVGTQSVTIQAPSLSSSYTLTLPTDDGVQYQFLQTDGNGALSFDYSKFSNAHYHVSSDGRSEYSSIQAAINAAEAAGACYATPKFVFVHGVFTEDLTISKTGIFLIGEDSQLNQLTRINGSLTFNKLSNTPDAQATLSLVYISSIFFNKASDNFVRVTGTNPQRIHFQDCFFYASSNSVFLADNTGTNSKVTINNCYFLAETNPAKVPLTISAGWVDVRNSVINQNAGSGSSAVLTDSALLTVSNTEINGTLTFTQTSYGFISSCSISTVSGSAIATTSTNPLGVGIVNSGLTVPAATSSVTGTGYLYHSNNTNGGLGGGFAATVAAIGLTSDTGNIRLPNRGTITLSESLLNGQNTLTITPPASVASNLTYTVPDVGANADFVMTQGTQTIAGAKTFSTAITGEINYVPADSGDWALPVPSLISSAVDQLADKKIGNVASLGTGETLVGAPVGTTANIKSLVAGTNVSFTSDANSVTINASGSGTITGGNNLGTGEGVYASVVGSNLNFKSLKAGTNIAVSSDSNEITINSTGGGSPTVIPDGGTLSGTYTGDVLLEGDASCVADVIVNGNLYSKEVVGKTLNINCYIVNIRGNVTLPEHTIATGTNLSGLPYSGFYTKGDLICATVSLNGVAGSVHINGSQLAVGGDIFVQNSVSVAGSFDALSGGNGGLVSCENFSAGGLDISGYDSQAALGSAGNGGSIYCKNMLRSLTSINLTGGDSIFAGATLPAGDGGSIICGKLHADTVDVSGGAGRVSGGNCFNIQVDTEINVSTSLVGSGGSSIAGPGGNATSVSCSGAASIGGLIMRGGDGATTGGSGGTLGVGSLVGSFGAGIGIDMRGGDGGTGNGGAGGTISCVGDLSLSLPDVGHFFYGGGSVSGNGGAGGNIRASNINLACPSIPNGSTNYLFFYGGDTTSGSAGGAAGNVDALGSIVTAFPFNLNGGTVSAASTGGNGGNGGRISFGQDLVLKYAHSTVVTLQLNGGSGIASSGIVRNAGRGGLIKWNTTATTAPQGGRLYSAGGSQAPSIVMNGGAMGISSTGTSADAGNSGAGGTISVGDAVIGTVSAAGSANYCTGLSGGGGTLQVRGNLILTLAGTNVNLSGGSAQAGSNSSGGSGGLISANSISVPASSTILLSGGAAIGSGRNGGSGGSITAIGNISVTSVVSSGGGASSNGIGGSGGSITSTTGNITTSNTITLTGGTSATGNGSSGGSITAALGSITMTTGIITLNGGSSTNPAATGTVAGNGGSVLAKVKISSDNTINVQGGSIGVPAADGFTLTSGNGGTIGSTSGNAPDIVLGSGNGLNGGNIDVGARTGTFNVGRGGIITGNNVYIGGITNLNGGNITGTATTNGPGPNGSFTARGDLTLAGRININYGASATSTTLQNSTTNAVSVWGTTTGTRLSAGTTPTISMSGASSTVAGGASSSVAGMTFNGRVSGQLDLLVRTVGAPAGGTVGRCGGIRFYGGCDITGTVTCSETGDPTATPPANNFTTGGIHLNGVCQIYQAVISPFNAARTTDMTFVCQAFNSTAAIAALSCGSFTYSYGDGSGSPATFIFRGLAGSAISGAEATTEPNTRHIYTMNSGTALTYKLQGAPV